MAGTMLDKIMSNKDLGESVSKLKKIVFFLFENEDELDYEKFLKIKDDLDALWEENKYGIDDMLLFSQALEFVENAELKMVNQIFQHLNILITPKDRKKGRDAYIKRLIYKFNKTSVRNEFTKIFSMMYGKYIMMLVSKDDDDNLEELEKIIENMVEDYSFEDCYWVYSSVVENARATAMLIAQSPIDYINMSIKMFVLYKISKFEIMMDSPEKLKDHNPLSPHEIMEENKELKRQISKEKRQGSVLKKEVHELSRERKKLKGEIHELYQDSLNEIDELRKENETLKNEFDDERSYYLEVINDLNNKIIELESQTTNQILEPATSFDLKGKTICVIGGNKKRPFAEAVEKYNGNIEFVSEDNLNKLEGAISRSDAVFYLTELVGHHHYKAYKTAKENGVPFKYKNSKGISSFERDLIEFIKSENES